MSSMVSRSTGSSSNSSNVQKAVAKNKSSIINPPSIPKPTSYSPDSEQPPTKRRKVEPISTPKILTSAEKSAKEKTRDNLTKLANAAISQTEKVDYEKMALEISMTLLASDQAVLEKDHEDLKKNYEELKGTLETSRQRNKLLQNQISKIKTERDADIEKVKKECLESNKKELAKKNEEIMSLKFEIEEKKDMISQFSEIKRKSDNQEITRLKERVFAQEQELQFYNTEINTLKSDHRDISQLNEDLTTHNNSLQSLLELEKKSHNLVKEEVATHKRKYEEFEKQHTEEINDLTVQNENAIANLTEKHKNEVKNAMADIAKSLTTYAAVIASGSLNTNVLSH